MQDEQERTLESTFTAYHDALRAAYPEPTFRDWMKGRDDLPDIAVHGCAGGFSGLIYYSETRELFDRYEEEIWEELAKFADEIGESPLANMKDPPSSAASYKNACVWIVAELYAQALAFPEESSEH